jgi:hypothetical protein
VRIPEQTRFADRPEGRDVLPVDRDLAPLEALDRGLELRGQIEPVVATDAGDRERTGDLHSFARGRIDSLLTHRIVNSHRHIFDKNTACETIA